MAVDLWCWRNSMEDKILILRFKHGSTDALCRIYRKYEGVMLTVAAGLLGDVHAAQDAVHDVFVAFSQARHTVSSTLSRLKAMITGDTDTTDMPPALEAAPDPNGRTIMCTASFFPVPPGEQSIWQSLKDSGIEFVQVSADPEVYFAAFSRRQVESFDTLQPLECVASPRILIREGQTAAIATANQEEARGLAIGWLSTVSDDGAEIRSTVSFHDGRNGFEISNVAMEPGGIAMIRAKDMWSYSDDADKQREYPQEMLIQVQVDLQQTP